MFPVFRAPETMTAAEQALLLKATAAHDDPRDHTLYSMALGTGLRLRELLALQRGGRVYLSNARLGGHFALRACLINFRTTRAHVESAIREVLAEGRRQAKKMGLLG